MASPSRELETGVVWAALLAKETVSMASTKGPLALLAQLTGEPLPSLLTEVEALLAELTGKVEALLAEELTEAARSEGEGGGER